VQGRAGKAVLLEAKRIPAMCPSVVGALLRHDAFGLPRIPGGLPLGLRHRWAHLLQPGAVSVHRHQR